MADTPREPVTAAGRLLFEGLLRFRGEFHLPQTLAAAILAIEEEAAAITTDEWHVFGSCGYCTAFHDQSEADFMNGRKVARLLDSGNDDWTHE